MPSEQESESVRNQIVHHNGSVHEVHEEMSEDSDSEDFAAINTLTSEVKHMHFYDEEDSDEVPEQSLFEDALGKSHNGDSGKDW